MKTMEIFGLTQNQSGIMYSLERMMVERDIKANAKDTIYKKYWLEKWMERLGGETSMPYTQDETLMRAIQLESEQSPNKTWFYIAMLEASLFCAYTPFSAPKDADKDETKKIKDENKHFQKLKYSDQADFLKKVAKESGIMEPEYVDRFRKTYRKTIDKLTGRRTKAALGAVGILATAGIGGALAAIYAGPIAVSLVGGSFAGVHGAALTGMSLAFIGGGSLAAGGAGVAGGVAVIAGGGAILGVATGGATVTAVGALLKEDPAFALTQAAKLEVVLKEIILNAQQDVQNAQAVMEGLRSQIQQQQAELDKMLQEQEKDKQAIANMKKSLDYLRKAYMDMGKFKSAYEIGMEIAEEESEDADVEVAAEEKENEE